MVNYRRVVCEVVVVAALLSVAVTAPADCRDEGHFDQRQNGTENFRVHVDGVVVAVMPVESIAESILDILPDINGIIDSQEDITELYQKPKPPAHAPAAQSPVEHLPPKPEEKPQAASQEPAAADSPPKPADAPLSDVSLDSMSKSQKKDATLTKQKKAQRVKNFLASVLMPLLRKNRHH